MSEYYPKVMELGDDVRVSYAIDREIELRFRGYDIISTLPPPVPELPYVFSVEGRQGTVDLTKADVGLDLVDNTADGAKPLSAAAIAALADKLDAVSANAAFQPKEGTVVLAAPTGVTATDDAALAAAITAAGSRGLILAQPGTYQISSAYTIPNGVDMRGAGGGSTSKSGTTTFKCMASGTQINIAGGGGLSGYFEIDGNLTATTPFKRSGGTGANARTFQNITVHSNAVAAVTNDLVEFYGAQNDIWIQCGFADADRDLAHFDQGYGGAYFLRCEWRTAGRYHHYYDSLVGGGVYASTSDTKHVGGICEGNSGISIVRVVTGTTIAYQDHPMYSINGCSGPMVDVDAGYVAIHNAFLQSTPSTQVAGTIGIRVNSTASVTLTGRSNWLNFATALSSSNNLAFIYDNSASLPSNTAAVRGATGSATVANIGQLLGGGTSYSLTANSDYVLFSLNFARNAQRFGIRSDGRLDWFPGTNFASDVGIARRGVGIVGVTLGTQQVLATGGGTTAQRPAAAAALAGAIYQNSTTVAFEWCDGTAWHSPTDHSWVNVAPAGVTTNPQGTGAPIGYTKNTSGLVVLRGLAAGVSINTALFTLPAGFRPGYDIVMPCFTMTGGAVLTLGYISITTAGVVKIPVGSGGIVSFDGVSYMAEQ